MPKDINPWARYSRKTSTASLPEALKIEGHIAEEKTTKNDIVRLDTEHAML